VCALRVCALLLLRLRMLLPLLLRRRAWKQLA
jgi:hypothetical protein